MKRGAHPCLVLPSLFGEAFLNKSFRKAVKQRVKGVPMWTKPWRKKNPDFQTHWLLNEVILNPRLPASPQPQECPAARARLGRAESAKSSLMEVSVTVSPLHYPPGEEASSAASISSVAVCSSCHLSLVTFQRYHPASVTCRLLSNPS